ATQRTKIAQIQLPQDDRLDSAFATELGQILSPQDIYCLHSHAVRVGIDEDELSIFKPISAEELCTLIEDYCVPYRIRREHGKGFRVMRSLDVNTARKILASPQFLRELREVQRLNCVSLPIIRPSGKMELLPTGYDPQSRVLTISARASYEQMSVDQ